MIQVHPPGSRARAALAIILFVAPMVAASSGGNPLDAAIASPTEGAQLRANETITFMDGSTASPDCPIVEWEWKFGASVEKYGRSVEHAYAAPGEQHVHLHVLGSCGYRDVAHVRFLIAEAPPRDDEASEPPSTEAPAPPAPQAPVASLVAPTRVVAGESVVLDASGSQDPDGGALTYDLRLDGEPLDASDGTAVAVLTRAGEHLAQLTVTDPDGLSSAPVEAAILVVPSALSAMSLQGPAVVAAGSTVRFDLLGEDEHGNAVALDPPMLEWTAPTRTGPVTVVHEVDGVQASLAVEVASGTLARIVLAAPTEVVVGRAAEFAVRGEDAHGNAVALGISTLLATPAEAGPFTVCHEEQGVRGCVTVVASEFLVSKIEIVAPARANRGRTIPLAAILYDDEGRARSGPVEWSTTEGTITPEGMLNTIKPTLVTARAGGKEATAQVQVTTTLTVVVKLPTPGEANEARVTVRYWDGTPVEGSVVFARIRHVVMLAQVIEKNAKATTGADGVAWVPLGDEWSVPGEHRVQASAAWNQNAGAGSRQTRHPV